MHKKLLIAGGGYAEIPLILAAQKMGFHVITSGNRADDLGHRYSDECCLQDFSDKEAMLQLADSLKIDAICASCNDFSAITAAYIAQQLNLPGHDSYETSLLIHHKDRYRAFAIENDIPSPRAKGFDSINAAMAQLSEFDFPVIVKPVDLTGGKGISRIDHIEDAMPVLESAFEISRAKRIVVEEFIEGTRHGFSTFLRDGRVVFFFNDNEHYFLNPYLVSAASTPANVPENTSSILCATAERIASLLNLKTGIFHIQYILQRDKPVIIEICRRAPGDLYIEFVKHATGIDYPAYIVRAASGMECNDLKPVESSGYYTRHCIMPYQNGIIKNVTVSPEIDHHIIDQMLWWKPGEQIDNHLIQKQGIVFLRFNTLDEMLSKTDRLPDLIHVEMK
ncbi:MAG: ATP-grasp domain-containing protein [Planctomycetaceae bacterium]|nr:ATP-grasp domain-containing protein [Planctomycetaceae bacterium]